MWGRGVLGLVVGLVFAGVAAAVEPCMVSCDGSPTDSFTVAKLFRNSLGCLGECGYTLATKAEPWIAYGWCPTVTKNGTRYGPELVCDAPVMGPPGCGCEYDPEVYR